MKTISVSLCLLLALISDISAARDDAAIKELAEGKRTEARAEWWGFDEKDATAAVQAAIDSKAKRVVIANVEAPWNVRPIKLASDQELVLEKGVVLQAVRGEFKSKHHMLLRGDGVKN